MYPRVDLVAGRKKELAAYTHTQTTLPSSTDRDIKVTTVLQT